MLAWAAGWGLMNVSVPKETASGERRVALVPEVVARLAKGGVSVTVERGAGESAHQPDNAYERVGASLGDGWSGEVVAKVAPPSTEEVARLGRGAVLIGFLQPLTAHDTVREVAEAGGTSFAMEAIPRITRAQSMDALSSQATVGGYRAVFEAAHQRPVSKARRSHPRGGGQPGAAARHSGLRNGSRGIAPRGICPGQVSSHRGLALTWAPPATKH
jgi:NAD/NADP transhydrogenase alpha subunit